MGFILSRQIAFNLLPDRINVVTVDFILLGTTSGRAANQYLLPEFLDPTVRCGAGAVFSIKSCRHTTHARVGLTNPGDPCALLLGFSVLRQHIPAPIPSILKDACLS